MVRELGKKERFIGFCANGSMDWGMRIVANMIARYGIDVECRKSPDGAYPMIWANCTEYESRALFAYLQGAKDMTE